MKELDKCELQEICGGYTKMPPWVKGSLWFGILCIVADNWPDIKAGIVDGFTDAMKEK